MTDIKQTATAWIVAARPFALPWIALNVAVGAVLAGGTLETWALATAIAATGLLAGHFVNNWRDYARGVDAADGGSDGKVYTEASQLLPSDAMTVPEMQAGAAACTLISVGLVMLYHPQRVSVWAVLALGLGIGYTYTDVFKPTGFPEVAMFLGHGLAATAMGWAVVQPVTLTPIAAGVITGLWAAVLTPADQWPDRETDLAKRTQNLADLIAGSEISLGQYVFGMTAFVAVVHLSLAFGGLVPMATLVAFGSLPLWHLTGILLDVEFEQGMKTGLTALTAYPALMVAGLLLPV